MKVFKKSKTGREVSYTREMFSKALKDNYLEAWNPRPRWKRPSCPDWLWDLVGQLDDPTKGPLLLKKKKPRKKKGAKK